jgi:hypothetical protein
LGIEYFNFLEFFQKTYVRFPKKTSACFTGQKIQKIQISKKKTLSNSAKGLFLPSPHLPQKLAIYFQTPNKYYSRFTGKQEIQKKTYQTLPRPFSSISTLASKKAAARITQACLERAPGKKSEL